MSTRSTEVGYGSIAVGMHWASAVLVLVQLVLGLSMTRLGAGDTDSMYQVHVGIGWAIALLTVGRVVWRVLEPAPPTPPMPEWRRKVYVANHVAFYVILLALAVGGIAMLVASGVAPFPTAVDAASAEDGRLRDSHFLMALAFAGLFVMHVAGVVSYQRSKGDVLGRMGVKGVATSAPTGDSNGGKRWS